MPLWSAVHAVGIHIIDVRDERAAVHMAQAHAELMGQLGVALVTAGPGVTNAITGIANAQISHAPVLVLSGTMPSAQAHRGALPELKQSDLVRSITAYASTVHDPSTALYEVQQAIVHAAGAIAEPGCAFVDIRVDVWSAQFSEDLPGSDGRMHPYRLLAAIQDQLPSNAVLVVDGGDFLSFAWIGLSAPTVLDPRPFGCLGIGVPYGIAASLACPDRPVFGASGDGAFGFNAIELDPAVRHDAHVVFIVANNGAWQIEVHDQMVRFEKTIGTRLQFSDYAAIGRAFGMYSERVEDASELPRALARAAAERPALLDVVVTPEAVFPDANLDLLRSRICMLATWDQAEPWRERAARISLEG
jgi:thiamine pyrophosphate-dependent acetolactate synthase large subunit-like protein